MPELNLRKIVDRYKAYCDGDGNYGTIAGDDIAALIDAVVEERANRMRSEFYRLHDRIRPCCIDKKHDWTDKDWRTQAKTELGIEGVWLIKGE